MIIFSIYYTTYYFLFYSYSLKLVLQHCVIFFFCSRGESKVFNISNEYGAKCDALCGLINRKYAALIQYVPSRLRCVLMQDCTHMFRCLSLCVCMCLISSKCCVTEHIPMLE